MATTVMPVKMSLREARRDAGLSQNQLADLAQVRKATISEIENGHAKSVSFEVLERLAKALGLHPFQLFIEKPQEKGKEKGK